MDVHEIGITSVSVYFYFQLLVGSITFDFVYLLSKTFPAKFTKDYQICITNALIRQILKGTT